ncbi:MAG: WGR domain-containing protein, predicted DNA-binding domain in MolR [Candidatus Kentron sp. G]|nr:MAG: WGR domain-containing protein, predicted DNA-binding domain in MolR [Candidatus Kentron sp. G]VFN03525.1 MAG: WGR domain-containing protein, predicted DNA-binding domain in MolR [Candidatus Kentron sp. G]VFN04061.1 MAG: WGR domain-containing protein, predicted DNA-binding domain in MolR [Candidatus Kentron sp. G]
MAIQPEPPPSAVYLRRVDPTQNISRFYSIRIEKDLFGEWCLVREWGRIGTIGRTRRDGFPDIGQALDAMEKLTKAKKRKGYFEIG